MDVRISVVCVHATYKCYNVGINKLVFKCVGTCIHACLCEYVLYRAYSACVSTNVGFCVHNTISVFYEVL